MRIRLIPRHEVEQYRRQTSSAQIESELREIATEVLNEPPCCFCSASDHVGRSCTEPVRRKWGWPNWEKETEARSAMFASASSESDEKGHK